jgi:DNA-binding transcriptional LysR family regulator
VFVMVAECGSFNAAAKRLGRALSVVSYAVTTLEAQLGLDLFDRQGSRTPLLTEAGRALLADARAVANEADTLVARARGIRQGLETRLALAIDVMMPPAAVARVLREFQSAFPTVDLRLHVEALGAVAVLVRDGEAELGVAGPDIADQAELARRAIGAVEMVPVAAPAHPLGTGAIGPGETARHLQLVLTDRSPLTRGRDFSVLSPRTWRLGDLGAKHALLLEGIGWGMMPRHAVAGDIAAGRLVELTLPEVATVTYQLNALWRRDRAPGPATAWMLEALAARCGMDGSHG